jgi:hypothetical protein
MIKLALACFLSLASAAFAAEKAFSPGSLAPAYLPTGRPAQAELTAELRAKVKTLGLDGISVEGGKLSKAFLLLPKDRGGAGVISFEIEAGSRAGVYQCEALGRGATSTSTVEGWQKGFIGGATIYYAPADATDGATIPGVYDLRNISPENYEIALLGKPGSPEKEAAVLAATKGSGAKPYFSGAWRDWYPSGVSVMPVDLIWAADSQLGSQGEGIPFFERRSTPSSEASKARQAAQLAHNPKYYYGPYGRTGFAVHTDSWEDPEKRNAPQYAGRFESLDFRWRDTSGCVKLRPACLSLLNEFISEQSALGRRVQLEAIETPLLDALPQEPPAK